MKDNKQKKSKRNSKFSLKSLQFWKQFNFFNWSNVPIGRKYITSFSFAALLFLIAGTIVYIQLAFAQKDIDQIEKDSILNLYQDNKHEKLELLTKVLDMLEQSDKDLLLLRAQNFSYEEIAKLLGIENNQLKVKHHRAKGKLLKLIENELINKKLYIFY